MYLSLALTLGSMLAVTLPVMASDRVVMEQSLDGDQSVKAQAELFNELKVVQTPLESLTNKMVRDFPESICQTRLGGNASGACDFLKIKIRPTVQG